MWAERFLDWGNHQVCIKWRSRCCSDKRCWYLNMCNCPHAALAVPGQGEASGDTNKYWHGQHGVNWNIWVPFWRCLVAFWRSHLKHDCPHPLTVSVLQWFQPQSSSFSYTSQSDLPPVNQTLMVHSLFRTFANFLPERLNLNKRTSTFHRHSWL